MSSLLLPHFQGVPLTASGRATGLLVIFSYTAGAAFGWVELVVLATGMTIALLVALPFVIGRLRLAVTRSLATSRVPIGDHAVSLLKLENQSRVAIGPVQVEEKIGVTSIRVDLSGLAPGGVKESLQPLPTDRRGVYDIGPAVITKTDPLGLMKREIRQTDVDQLWVHPKLLTLPPVPSGFARDLEGPSSEMSPAGDVSFHALRDYEPGDDHRHVHWLSSARTGALVVRQFVDNRLPFLTVLLDDRSIYSAEANETPSFDVAVAIAGSLSISSVHHQLPVAFRIGDQACLRHHQPINTDDLLDHLTLAESTGSKDLTEQVDRALQDEPDTSALVLVTGGGSAQQLLPAVKRAKSTMVIIVRVWGDQDERRLGHLPGATTLDVSSLDEFGSAWTRLIGEGLQ